MKVQYQRPFLTLAGLFLFMAVYVARESHTVRDIAAFLTEQQGSARSSTNTKIIALMTTTTTTSNGTESSSSSTFLQSTATTKNIPANRTHANSTIWNPSTGFETKPRSNSRNNNNDESVKYIYRTCGGGDIVDGAQLYDSPRLLFTSDPDQRDAWWINECMYNGDVVSLVNQSYHRRIILNGTMTKEKMDDLLGDWRIILIDYKDLPSMSFVKGVLEGVSRIVGVDRVYMVTRGVTASRNLANQHAKAGNYKRMFDPKFLGHRVDFKHDFVGKVCAGVKPFHFCVRDDVLEALEEDLINYANDTGLPATIDPVDLPRPNDVAHFWSPTETRRAQLRARVSQMLLALNQSHPERNLTIYADIVGSRGKQGRTGVDHAYTHAMLELKILVLAQRDRYEDHFRLFEALSSGAMIMSDPALVFPWGVVDGKTIVVYRDLSDMQEKVLYYLDRPEERLRIARAGRELALKHHRVWHRYNDLILGNWTSKDEFGVSLLRP